MQTAASGPSRLVQIVLFDGFDLLDAIAPYEVFWAASLLAPAALAVEFATIEGPRQVPSGSNGVCVAATATLDAKRADILVVPGAAGRVSGEGDDTIPALLARAAASGLPAAAVQAMARPGVTVATVCGGSLLLALGGILNGRHAVTHHMGMEVLAATGAVAVQARVVDDGNFVSSGSVTSGLDLGLYLLERELGPRVALAVEGLFAYERRGTVWRALGQEPGAL
jgi:transcriptional regulator GlxA family with amidase domain